MPESTTRITRTLTVTTEEFSEVENYLRTYAFYKKLLMLDKYEQDYFAKPKTQYPEALDRPSEIALAHAKMFEVRHFIMSMQNCNEKLLLYYHYVRGDSVERCAELIGISRSSAFRLKKRALILAAEFYRDKLRRESGISGKK
ncbi:MAG: hypothetical protein J6M03_00030 [Clostridia bacterium]|nr:hypothetical protein [Clostridia bacterium]